MTVGYDSGDLRPARFTPEQSRTWLHDIRANSHNHDWLHEHHNTIYHVIRESYLYNQREPDKATRALLSVLRYMLTQVDYHRWWQLYWESTLEAGYRHDHILLNEINANFGQAFLIKGDIARARHLFHSVIHGPKPVYNTIKAQTDEHTMLAYIGLVKVESWDYSEVFNQDTVDAALALAKHLDDLLLTDLLYQALGAAYAHRKELAHAVAYCQTSLGYSFARGDFVHAVMTGIALASAYRKAALFDRAQETLRFVQRLAKRVNHPQAIALAAYEQGVVEYYFGNFEAAEKWIQRAQTAFNTLNWKRHWTMTEHMLGNVAMALKQFELAEARLLKGLALWRELGHVYEQASILYDLGDLHRQWDKPELALSYLDQSYAVCEHIPPMDAVEELVQMIFDCRAKIAPNESKVV